MKKDKKTRIPKNLSYHSTALHTEILTLPTLEFAFCRFGLAKMMTYIYADNPHAQLNALHLGYEQEGVLRSHIATSSGRIDLFVNGITSVDFSKNPLLKRLMHRWKANAFVPDKYLTPACTVASDKLKISRTLPSFKALTGGTYYLGALDALTDFWRFDPFKGAFRTR